MVVRSSMVTYGGNISVELVFGRKPRDVVTIQNVSPEQLTTPATAVVWLTRHFKKCL